MAMTFGPLREVASGAARKSGARVHAAQRRSGSPAATTAPLAAAAVAAAPTLATLLVSGGDQDTWSVKSEKRRKPL